MGSMKIAMVRQTNARVVLNAWLGFARTSSRGNVWSILIVGPQKSASPINAVHIASRPAVQRAHALGVQTAQPQERVYAPLSRHVWALLAARARISAIVEATFCVKLRPIAVSPA